MSYPTRSTSPASIRKPSFTRLLNGPIPNTGGFLHILFAVLPLFLSVTGVSVYFLEVNTSNHTAEAVFLALLSAITAGYSTYNAYNTYTGGFTRSNSLLTSFAASLIYILIYIYYINAMIKEKH